MIVQGLTVHMLCRLETVNVLDGSSDVDRFAFREPRATRDSAHAVS